MAIDQTLAKIIGQYTALLATDSEQAIATLLDYKSTFETDSLYLQTLGEAYLEINDVELAYETLQKACELDPTGAKGVEKFFHLGQIIGGRDGVNIIEVGIAELIREFQLVNEGNGEEDDNILILVAAYETQAAILNYLLLRMTRAIGSIIEIWMTDLCMEEEAELECEKWCNMLHEMCDQIPETHSLIASVRISQQKFEDAELEITKAWELYKLKKLYLEENNLQDEYLDLYEQLLTLAKYSLECGLFELSIDISSCAREINEDSIESAYLEGFSNYLEAIRLQLNINESEAWKIGREFENYSIDLANPVGETYIQNCQFALSSAVKLLYNPELAEACDEELKITINELLKSVGGFVAKEPKIDVNDNSVLDEITDA